MEPASQPAPDVSTLPPWQAARRTAIIAAARELLEEEAYDQIQIKDVASRAAVALGTLYRYFRSKEQVYAAVLDDWTSWAEAPPVAGATAEERLRRRVHLLIGSVERRPNFFMMELALQSTSDPQVRATQSRWSRAGAAWLVSDLAVLGEERSRHPAVMLWAVVSHVLTQAIRHGETFAEARATMDELISLLAGPLAEAEARTSD